MSSLSSRDAWRVAGIAIVTLLVLTFILYQPTMIYLTGLWNQLEAGEYGHGYLVLMISGYLIWVNRRRLAALRPCPEYRAILVVVAASILWMVAALVDIAMLQTVGLLLLVMSIVWALLGTQVARILVFPVLYIGFAIPIWFPLSPLLQDLTADAVFWMIRVLEIPALREGNMIVIAAGKLSIEEACSGLRYFLAALTLGTLYAYLNFVTLRDRLLVVLVSAGAGVLANILRVFIVVYLAYKTYMQHPLVHDHLMFGWYIFGGLVVVLLAVDTLLHRMRPHSTNGAPVTAVYKQALCNKDKSQLAAFVLVAAFFISAGPLALSLINSQAQPDNYPVQIQLASVAGAWSGVDTNEDDWMPQYQGAISHKQAFQDKNNREIVLYLGLYPAQRQGEELINDLNRISDGKIWRIRYQKAKLHNSGGQQAFEQLLEKKDGSQLLVWYWYRVAGQDTVNKYQAKALQVLGLLKGMRQAAIVAIATRPGGEPESARKILAQFAEDMGSSIDRVIDSNI